MRYRALFLLLVYPLAAFAQRDPVLKQIDLPHAYYYREMYLPQLTTGPSFLAWAPDSRSLIYSMAGSLWQQKLGITSAQQLTSGPGYDYQPDCSPDGKWVIYDSYNKDAVELWALARPGCDFRIVRPANQQAAPSAVGIAPRRSPPRRAARFARCPEAAVSV